MTLVILFIFLSNSIQAQKNDSIQAQDSLRLYKKIKHFAYKHKFTSLLYDAIFVDPEPKEYPIQPASKEQKNVNPYFSAISQKLTAPVCPARPTLHRWNTRY